MNNKILIISKKILMSQSSVAYKLRKCTPNFLFKSIVTALLRIGSCLPYLTPWWTHSYFNCICGAYRNCKGLSVLPDSSLLGYRASCVRSLYHPHTKSALLAFVPQCNVKRRDQHDFNRQCKQTSTEMENIIFVYFCKYSTINKYFKLYYCIDCVFYLLLYTVILRTQDCNSYFNTKYAADSAYVVNVVRIMRIIKNYTNL